jgi:dTDP-4-amino-4,6-dideoxygalactose transaminase
MTTSINVPLLDLKAQFATIKDEIKAAIDRVVESQYFIMGPDVAELEKGIAEYVGSKFAIGCASGSDAIMLALMALGVGRDDEVICPSFTFFATGGYTTRVGAKPIYAEIDPVTYNMDPDHTRQLAKNCKRLKAIMPVHLFGQAADMDAFMAIGKEFGVPIVEDAAQAIGTKDTAGISVGTRGAIGCFSFFPSKNLGAFGDGGIVTTNDAALAESLSILRVHGGKPKYYHKVIGCNSRLDSIQAAVLKVKLRYLDQWTAGRQKNAAYYDQKFKSAGASTSATPLASGNGLPLRTPHPGPSPARHIYNQYVIRVPAELRDPLRKHLTDQKIGTEIYYPVPLHLQECFRYLGGKVGDLPESESAANETLALPIYPELTQQQLDHVVNQVLTFVKQHAPARA